MTPAAHMLLPYVRRQWKALAGAGGATGVLTLADLAKPWPLALVVDRLLGRDAPFELGASDWQLLAGVAALVLVIALAEAGAQYLSNLWLQTAGERISHELRIRVYDHLQALSLAYHQKRQKGDLLTRVTGDVNAMGDLFSQSLGAIAQAGLLAFGMTVVLLAIDPVLALVSLATAPLLAVISLVYRRRVRVTARVRRAHEGRIASVAAEALSAMAVVKAFGSERLESDRVRAGSEQRMAVGVEVARLQAGFDGLVGAVRALGTALVLVAGVLRVAAGALSPGELLVFVSYTRRAYNPLKSLARESTKVAAALAKADRIAEILAADDVLADRPGAYRGPRAAGDVALERVSFAYAPGRPVLHDVSLRIPAGSSVALVGPSGAGKSTLEALVARFHDPTGGRVLIDGRDARDCALEWLRAQVAILLQDTVLFSGTVRDNIAYGSAASADEVEAAARAAAAHEFIRELPDGYDTELDPQGGGLSGGQRQRIGIARTLLRDPPILLLDEPTTALDADSEAQLLDGLRALMEGRTTVLVTHSSRLARMADRVVRIERGRIADTRRAVDPGLPQLERLLDPAAMEEVLARTLEPGAAVSDVAVGRVVYKPHELVAVHYRVAIAGRRHDAVATSIAGVDLAERARRPQYVERARRIDGRSPARLPLAYDPDVGAIVTWLPYDPRLPALGEPGAELLRRLEARAGGDPAPARRTGACPGGEPELIGYKPRGRAVLRIGPLVLKAYGREREFESALAGLVTASGGPLPTAGFVGSLPELRLTAQRHVDGRRAGTAAEVATEAGAMAAALQRAELAPGLAAPPDRLLDAALRKAAVVETVLPELGGRLAALAGGLRDGLPAGLALAPAHGDFHADQLLVRGRRHGGRRLRPDVPGPGRTRPGDLRRRRDPRPAGGPRPPGRRARAPARGLRGAPGRARLAPGGGDPRARRPPVPAPGPGLARARGGNRRGSGGEPVTRALVTGCAGFIGSHLAEALLATGHEVVGVDCFSDNYPRAHKQANLAAARDHDRFTFAAADLVTVDAERLLDGIDVVFHLAAEPGVRSSWGRRFDRYLRNNVRATQRLLEASAARPERRIVYASSSSVYGESERLPTPEDATPQPLSPYGVTKLAAEQLCRLYHANHGVDAVALRFFSVYGPRQRPDMAFRCFCEAAVAGTPIELYGDGRQTRDFTFVGDVVAAARAAAVAGGVAGQVYNIGGGARVSLAETLELLAGIAGRPLDVRRRERESGDVQDTGADIDRARAELGFAPATSLADGLRAEFEWVREREQQLGAVASAG